MYVKILLHYWILIILREIYITHEVINCNLFCWQKWTNCLDLICKHESVSMTTIPLESLCSGDKRDIITLNVSGTMMATKSATLMVAEDSVLAQQFDDSKWTEQGNNNLQVKELVDTRWCDELGERNRGRSRWYCYRSLFLKNRINGLELLALDRDGLNMFGVERVVTLCVLFDEIQSLNERRY